MFTLAAMRDSVLAILSITALIAAPAAAETRTPDGSANGAAQAAPKTEAAVAKPAAPRPAPAPAAPESPEVIEASLRSAREQLLALVDEDTRRAGATEDDVQSALRVGTPAASLTSALPETQTAPAASSKKDLSWLEGLALPDFPVRWDDRLVRMLESYRDDARSRATVRGLLARKGRYETMIREKLRAAGVPEDLAYVAMVESAYDPAARSEVGAVGVWQFMASPAEDYDLEITRWVDQRMSPDASTDAAARYFKDLYADLGSWPLAMAAFNMGYGALLRSMQKYNSNDFWLLSNLEAGLPYETITYVTRITACAIVGHNLERFGLADVTPDPEVRTTAVDVPGGIGLARVAHVIGIEADALAQLNPELKKSRVPPDVKTWSLRIPRDRASRFSDKWPSSASDVPAHREHVMKLGERLTDIAAIYDTSVSKLRKLNDLEDADSVRAGSKLLVPDVEPSATAKPDAPLVAVSGDQFVYVDRKRVFYRVADGDSLQDIAKFFSINSDEIRMWNSISPDAKLQRGMYLQLFVPAEADLSQALVLTPDEVRTLTVGSEEFFDFHETQQNRVRLRYRCKAGDTLRSLAERFELSVGSIARINQFSRDKKLEPDAEIIVYVPEDTAKRLASK